MAIELGWQTIVGIVSLVVLLCISGLISGTEVAFFSLTKADLEDESNLNIKQVNHLLEGPKKLLATILIANNFVNILFILLFTYVGDYLFSNLSSTLLKFLIEIVLVTFLILLFGEVLPKIYASRNAYGFASFMAKPMIFLNSMLSFFCSSVGCSVAHVGA